MEHPLSRNFCICEVLYSGKVGTREASQAVENDVKTSCHDSLVLGLLRTVPHTTFDKGIRRSILGGELKTRNVGVADSDKWKATAIDNFPYHHSVRIEISLKGDCGATTGAPHKESPVSCSSSTTNGKIPCSRIGDAKSDIRDSRGQHEGRVSSQFAVSRKPSLRFPEKTSQRSNRLLHDNLMQEALSFFEHDARCIPCPLLASWVAASYILVLVVQLFSKLRIAVMPFDATS